MEAIRSENDFTTDSFEARPSGEGREKKGFVALETEGPEDSAFAPLVLSEGENGEVEPGWNSPPLGEGKAPRLEKEAYEKGFSQGEKDGLELGEKKAQKVLANIESLLAELAGLREQVVRHYEKEILEIVFAISAKIVRTGLELNQNGLRDTLFEALQFAAEKSSVDLKVNPQDFNYVEQLKPEIFSRFSRLGSIIINSDSSIARGGCYLETSNGLVDASVETQLERIRQSLKEAFAEGG